MTYSGLLMLVHRRRHRAHRPSATAAGPGRRSSCRRSAFASGADLHAAGAAVGGLRRGFAAALRAEGTSVCFALPADPRRHLHHDRPPVRSPGATASMFNMNDPTVRDSRDDAAHRRKRMIRTHPLTGVGPTMVAAAVHQLQRERFAGRAGRRPPTINPHLHKTTSSRLPRRRRPLPALALWLWFVVALVRDLWRRFHGRTA